MFYLKNFFQFFKVHIQRCNNQIFNIKMQIKIIYKDKQNPYTLQPGTTVDQFRKNITRLFNLPQDQLALSFLNSKFEKVQIKDSTNTLSDLGIVPQSKIIIKNLGKQIKWEHVFYIQYLGPIIIIPLFYFFGKRQKYQLVQHMSAIMGISHFLKRQLETKFVHVFSRKTMPFHRVFINSGHYWILFGLLNSIQIFLFPKQMKWDSNDCMILFLIWILMEFLNFKCHEQMASFRKNDKKSRGIPKKWGFKFVSCANYLWETLGWLTFSILTRCFTSFIFTGVSGAQMISWALKKHKQYKKQFGNEYPRQRKAIIPYLL